MSERSGRRWLMLAVVFIARLSLGYQFQSIGAVTPLIIDELGLSYVQIGWLIGLYSLPGVVLAFPAGLFGRRFGERAIAIVGLALMVLGAVVTASSHGFMLAALGRTVSGAGFIVANTVFAKMVADWFTGKEIATAMAIMLTAWPMGIGLGLVSLGAIASATSWRIAVNAGGMAAALGLLLVLLVYRRPPAADDAPVVSDAAIAPREVRLSLVGGLTWGTLNGALLVVLGFAPALLVAMGGRSVAQAGAIISLTLWVTLLSIPIGGQLVDRLGQGDYAIVFGGVATALCIGALPGFGAPAFWCVMIALTMSMPPGAIMALLPRAVRPEVLATAFGIFYSVYYAVVALAQPIAGFVRDRMGDAASPIIFAALLMGATAVTHLVFIAVRAETRKGAAPPVRPSSPA